MKFGQLVWLRSGLVGFAVAAAVVFVIDLRADVVTEPTAAYGFGTVDTAVISLDRRHLATAGPAGVFIWDFASGTNRLWLRDHQTRVAVLAFSPNSKVLLSAGRDNVLRAWDPETGKMQLSVGPLPSETSGVEFSPDGTQFLAFGLDGKVRVWRTESGELLHTLDFPRNFLNSVVFTPDGEHVVVAEGVEPMSVRRWNLGNQSPVATYTGHVGAGRALAFLSDGRLVSGGDDRTVRLWEQTSGNLELTFLGHSEALRSVAPAGSGMVLGASFNGRVVTWNIGDGVVRHDFQDFPLSAGVVLAEAQQILTVHPDETVRLRDYRTGEVLRQFVGHSTSTTLAVAYSPDERHLVSSGTEASIRLWERTSRTLIHTFEGLGSGSSVAKFTPDGSRVLTARGLPQPIAQLWEVNSGKLEREFVGHAGWIFAASFTPNGQRLATGSGVNEFRIRIWDVATGTSLRILSGHQNWIRSVAFSQNGTLLASGSDDLTVRIWNPETGQPVRILEGHQATVKSVTFSPDGGELLSLSEDGEVRFWEVETWKTNRTFRVPGGFVSSADWSPNGRLVVTGEGWPFFAARIWDARTGEMLRVLAGNTGPVETVAFGPRGLSVLTGSEVVRLWSVADLAGRLTARPSAPNAGQLELEWSLGTLQRAPKVDGPWNSVAGVSPWQVPFDSDSEFFRVQVPEE